MKTGTNPKTVRIPNDTIADIEREASAKDTTFSDIAINRLRHKDNALTPQILSKLQSPIIIRIVSFVQQTWKPEK